MAMTPQRIERIVTRAALALGYLQMWAWLLQLPEMNRQADAEPAYNALVVAAMSALGYLLLYGAAYGVGWAWLSLLGPTRRED